MGSSASPVVADIVMEELLDKCIENCDIKPKVLTKYVDDLFGISKISAIDNILTIFNSFKDNIKFTIEIEKDQKLPYLDTLLIRNDKRILVDWYQKPTASGRLINFHSKHPKRMIINTATNFINRVLNVSDKEFHQKNKIKIKQILTQNSFPKQTIERLLKRKDRNKDHVVGERPMIYKTLTYIPKLSERFEKSNMMEKTQHSIAHTTNNTLRNIFTNLKTKTNTGEKSNVIYKIKCNGDGTEPCDKYYIGTTKNKLKTRISGHRSDIKLRNNNLTQKTALATHCATTNHDADLENVRVLESESNYNKRLTMEMLHILNTPTTQRINYKTDVENLAQSYIFLIRKINRE